MKRKKIVKMIAAIMFIVLMVIFTFTTYKHIRPIGWNVHNRVNQAVFSDKAIEGYDPVAYFTQQKAIKGMESNSYKWNGATWYFSSVENLNLFKTTPEKYAPQFGGYCSYAVSTGFTAKIEPEAFETIDGKLYLFNDQNFKSKWMENQEVNLRNDINNWAKTK